MAGPSRPLPLLWAHRFVGDSAATSDETNVPEGDENTKRRGSGASLPAARPGRCGKGRNISQRSRCIRHLFVTAALSLPHQVKDDGEDLIQGADYGAGPRKIETSVPTGERGGRTFQKARTTLHAEVREARRPWRTVAQSFPGRRSCALNTSSGGSLRPHPTPSLRPPDQNPQGRGQGTAGSEC